MSEYTDLNHIIERLLLLDEFCTERGIKGEIVLLGGSGILAYMELQGEGSFRPTMDIDVDILASNKGYKEFQRVLIDVNIDVVGGSKEVPPPEDFKDKNEHYVLDKGFKSIDVYVPSIELLVCTKLFSVRQKDLDDLENTGILEQCNLDKLEELTNEYYENLINPTDPYLNFHELDRLLTEKGLK